MTTPIPVGAEVAISANAHGPADEIATVARVTRTGQIALADGRRFARPSWSNNYRQIGEYNHARLATDADRAQAAQAPLRRERDGLLRKVDSDRRAAGIARANAADYHRKAEGFDAHANELYARVALDEARIAEIDAALRGGS